VSRLTGRSIHVPEAAESVALGAALQSTAVVRGEELSEVTRRWGTASGAGGFLLDPVPVDEDRLARIRAVMAGQVADAGRAAAG
jgi:xylulokinase